MVQMKNRVSGLLMETGVEYNKQRLHKVSYFRELLSTNTEVHPSIRPLLKLSRETIERCQKTEYALVSSLQRDPVLADRIKRLRTVPGVGPITALTWALEIGDVSRFRTIKNAISYCGLCGDERSSADKVMRMPLSKQRNKHIQRALVEAAKLAPRQSHELAVIHEKEKQKGNGNRATLAVARKMVAYLLGVDRQQRDFVPAEERRTPQLESCHKISWMNKAQTARSCRLPTERRSSSSRGSLRIVSGLAENTNSIFCDSSLELEAANGCLVLPSAGTDAGRHALRIEHPSTLDSHCALSRARPGHPCLRLTDDLHGCRLYGNLDRLM
jgi:Transposase IS116/IS110/IS902 family